MIGEWLAASARLLLVEPPANSLEVPHFMTSPGAECTTVAFEKHRVWPMRAATGKVTLRSLIAIRRYADIMQAYKIIVLF